MMCLVHLTPTISKGMVLRKLLPLRLIIKRISKDKLIFMKFTWQKLLPRVTINLRVDQCGYRASPHWVDKNTGFTVASFLRVCQTISESPESEQVLPLPCHNNRGAHLSVVGNNDDSFRGRVCQSKHCVYFCHTAWSGCIVRRDACVPVLDF